MCFASRQRRRVATIGKLACLKNAVQCEKVVLVFGLAQLVDQVRSKHESLNVMKDRGSSSTLG